MSTISQLIIEQGRNAAQAAERKGQIWGQAISEAAQIPNQFAQQRQATAERQAAMDIARRRELREEAQHASDQALKSEQAQRLHQQEVGAHFARFQDNPAPELVQGGIQDAVRMGLIPAEVATPMLDLAKTPDGAKQVVTRLAPYREDKIAAVDPTHPLVNMRTGATVRPGVAAAPKNPTELAWDAANPQSPTQAQSTTALDLSKPPKTEPVPRPLDQQLLEAVVKGDTAKIGQIKQTMLTEAVAKRDPAAASMAMQLASLRVDEAKARLDEKDTGSDKNQQKFEQQYRTVLTRGLSSRNGGLGLEDSKVQQANHLLALLDQTYDPNTDSYTIPKTLQGELAAGLARLVAPGGTVGVEMLRAFDQRTAKGDISGALSYVTGHPFPTSSQDFAKLLKDSIQRQGTVAFENREGEMRYLRGLAPTDLNEERRIALEKSQLNPLRQSRLAVDATGKKKVFVSTDGGVTWK